MDPDPVVVGNSFVMRYYTVLNGNPEILHQFYHERSTMTFGHDDEPQGQTIHGIESIQKSIASHDFKGCTVSLSVLDCQASAHGGVFICAIGYITSPGDEDSHRKFVHNFFLERTANGSDTSYYVLNDVFRYIDSYDEYDEQPYDDQAPVHTTAPAVQAPVVHAPSSTPAQAPPTATPAPAPASASAAPVAQTKPATSKAAATKGEASTKTDTASPATESQKPERKPADKKGAVPASWAAAVGPVKEQNKQAQQGRQENQAEARLQQTKDTPAVVAPNPSRGSRGSGAPGPIIRPGSPVLQEGCSIFASNVPYEAKAEQLTEVFNRYNRVRNVVLKSAKGFAFIEFESPEATKAAWNAMQADPPHVNGRLLTVEERKQRGEQSPRGGFGRGGRGGLRFPRNKDASGSPDPEGRQFGFGSGKPDQQFNSRRGYGDRGDRNEKNDRSERTEARNDRADGTGGKPAWENKRTTSGSARKS